MGTAAVDVSVETAGLSGNLSPASVAMDSFLAWSTPQDPVQNIDSLSTDLDNDVATIAEFSASESDFSEGNLQQPSTDMIVVPSPVFQPSSTPCEGELGCLKTDTTSFSSTVTLWAADSAFSNKAPLSQAQGFDTTQPPLQESPDLVRDSSLHDVTVILSTNDDYPAPSSTVEAFSTVDTPFISVATTISDDATMSHAQSFDMTRLVVQKSPDLVHDSLLHDFMSILSPSDDYAAPPSTDEAFSTTDTPFITIATSEAFQSPWSPSSFEPSSGVTTATTFTPVSSPSSFSTSTASTTKLNVTVAESGDAGLSAAAIAGISIGAVIGILLIAIVIILLYKHKQAR